MSGGIPALEGFDYQAMVDLELMLDHFDAYLPAHNPRARPEGVDDLDLVHDEGNVTHRVHVQIKKPKQDDQGLRRSEPWTLSETIGMLLAPRWVELQDVHTRVWWVLGDELGPDALALFNTSDLGASWAARRAAAEWIVRDRGLADTPSDGKPLRWRSPFHAGTWPEGDPAVTEAIWRASFTKRANKAGFSGAQIDGWIAAIEETHSFLDVALDRVELRAPYAEAYELRQRLVQRLADRFGLDVGDVRQLVFRNLRGFVDDVARIRGRWLKLVDLEDEIVKIWPQLVPTVLPPPLPRIHLPRPEWVQVLVRRPGAVVGPSGTGKTTSATELFERLRASEPDTAVLYAEVQQETAWRNVLEGVAYAVGRRGDTALYQLLPSIRAGKDEALLSMAEALERADTAVALVVDLIDGVAHDRFLRDVTRFVQALPPSSRLRLWFFGQIDALGGLADAERRARGLGHTGAAGLDLKAFLALAQLHGFHDQGSLGPVYEALTSGRDAGVPPRVAEAVLSQGSIETAVAIARSDDVLLAADISRYERLQAGPQFALGGLACLTHPFRVDEAQSMFPDMAVKAGVRAGLGVGLLHPLGDGRVEFHETVRRNVLTQVPPAVLSAHHTRLADAYLAQGDRVLEANHAKLAGDDARGRDAGRAAFFDAKSAHRIAERAVAQGWVTPPEVLACIRAATEVSHGWWQALAQHLDDDTARALISWWGDALEHDDQHPALWSAPRVLMSARPDLVTQLLDLVTLHASGGNVEYGASTLGARLRDHGVDEELVLDRFERATTEQRAALAAVLHASGAPRCLARWLAHVIQTGQLSPATYGPFALSLDHVRALLDALPDVEPSQVIVHRDWQFGAATPFLLQHRDDIGDGAAQLLESEELEAKLARVAFRLLGLVGHRALFQAARRWSRRESEARSMALSVPALVDAIAWRPELAALALDTTVEPSTRIAAFATHVQSGSGSEELLSQLATISPELERGCRFMVAMSFPSQPSLFALRTLVDLLDAHEDPGVLGISLFRASHFADGPDAPSAVRCLLPLLERPDPQIRLPVLQALTMLRQPEALQKSSELAVSEAGTAVGNAATLAACASRPTALVDVREAIEANPDRAWLLSALAARFEDQSSRPNLLALARDTSQRWQLRRRALRSLERLPPGPDIDEVLDTILAEPNALGVLDSVDGDAAALLAGNEQDNPGLLVQCLGGGEKTFIELFGPQVSGDDQVEAYLRNVWQAFQTTRERVDAARALEDVFDQIQLSQVQAAALGVAQAFGKVDILEYVLANHPVPWLVFQALCARACLEPRTSADAQRWTDLVEAGPCGHNSRLRDFVSNYLAPLRTFPQPGARRPGATAAPAVPPTFTAEDILDHLREERDPPANLRIGDLDRAALAEIIALLNPDDDSVVEVIASGKDSSRVTLTTDSATLRGHSARYIGRKGKRPVWRARVFARYPDAVPGPWLSQLHRGQAFRGALIDALADEGDPVRALEVLQRLPECLTGSQEKIYRLGPLADEALVEWVAQQSGSGGPAQVKALASFASNVRADAAIPLLRRLMNRLEGHAISMGAVFSRNVNDPWLYALSHILRAHRLRDVPGAGAWLVAMLTKTTWWSMRSDVIQAMAHFPSTWSMVEAEAASAFKYGHWTRTPSREAEQVAHALFWAEPLARLESGHRVGPGDLSSSMP